MRDSSREGGRDTVRKLVRRRRKLLLYFTLDRTKLAEEMRMGTLKVGSNLHLADSDATRRANHYLKIEVVDEE